MLVSGNDVSSPISGQESSNKISEVEVEIQIIDFKDVYNKRTKKTTKGLKYCLEDSEVTIVAQATDEITRIHAYTQRCVEAAIRTHDTVGRILYNGDLTHIRRRRRGRCLVKTRVSFFLCVSIKTCPC